MEQKYTHTTDMSKYRFQREQQNFDDKTNKSKVQKVKEKNSIQFAIQEKYSY